MPGIKGMTGMKGDYGMPSPPMDPLPSPDVSTSSPRANFPETWIWSDVQVR